MYVTLSTEIIEVQISIIYETLEPNRSQDCCINTNRSELSAAHPKCASLATPTIANSNKEIPTEYKQNGLFKLQNIIQTRTVPIFITTCVLAQKKNVLLRGTADFRYVT